MSPVRRLRRFGAATLVTAGILALPTAAPAQLTGTDISVSKADSPDPVAVGTNLTYTITVANHGPAPAPGVVVTDALVLTLDFVSATASQGSCSELLLVVTCNLGSLASGATATVTLVVKPNVQGALLNAVAAVPTPPALDLDPLDNVAVESTTVTGAGGGPGADLAVSKADAPDPVAPGHTLNYTVTVQNLGSGDASGVQIVDVLPPIGAAFVSAAASQGSCGAPTANLVLVCNIGGLAAGASATVQVQVQPTAAGNLVNTATGVATSLDTNPLNNVSATSTAVDPEAATPGGGGGGGGGQGGGGAGGPCTILGTPLADILSGTPGNDVICGLDGNDRLVGKGGKDVLRGGKHNDRGNGGKGPDTLTGQHGKDRLRGAAKNDRLNGGGSRDRLSGGPGKDRVNGGGGKDRCARGKGDKIRKCP
jgi:uncharacterized repeat protein (TIGR01451 family)